MRKELSGISFVKAFRVGLVMLLTSSIILLSGCSDNEKTESAFSSQSSASSTVDSVSSDGEEASEPADPLSGEYSYTDTVSNVNDSIPEILPVGNVAKLYRPLTGFFDKEAEALRNEILNSANTASIYKIKGKKYYVSSNKGDDSNDGLSENKPLKSTDAVMSLNLNAGDAVLFERGSVFRLASSFLAADGVTYGSYGKGEKPKFYGSPENLANAFWTPSVKKNVWQMDYVFTDCGSLYFDHGEGIGYKKTALRNCNKNYDFYRDTKNNILYIYCDKGNPSKVFESIEAATQLSIFQITAGVSDVLIDNICMKYSGVMGVSVQWDAKNITVTNCEIGFIGGGYHSNGSSRYGNAVQFWTGSENVNVTHNWVYQVFDTAISWQGYGGNEFKYENINFNNNLLEYNNADFEYWDAGSSVKNFKMENNIMRFTSLGWGSHLENGNGRGIDGCFTGNTLDMKEVENFVIKDNIIDSPGRLIIKWDVNPERIGKKIKISGTKIYVNSDYRADSTVIRGFQLTENDPTSIKADTADEFYGAIGKFDKTAKLMWK